MSAVHVTKKRKIYEIIYQSWIREALILFIQSNLIWKYKNPVIYYVCDYVWMKHRCVYQIEKWVLIPIS